MADISEFWSVLHRGILSEQQRSPDHQDTLTIVSFPRLLPGDPAKQRLLWNYFTVGDGKQYKDQLHITHSLGGNFPNKDITFPVGTVIPFHLRGLTAAQFNHEVSFAAAIATVKANAAIGVVMPNILVTFNPPPLPQVPAAVPAAIPAAIPAAVPAAVPAVVPAAIPAVVPAVVAPVVNSNSDGSWDFSRLLWNAQSVTQFGRNEYKRYSWLKGCLSIKELFDRGRSLNKQNGVPAASLLVTRKKSMDNKRKNNWQQSKRLS